MYHRILPDDKMNEDLDLGMAVSCSDFEKQIKTLKSKYSLVSIDDFIKNLENNKKIFMVNITFDDGYKDNLTYALPILEKYKVPASIYITTRFLEKNVSMWWYEIKKIINNKKNLNFTYGNKNYNFKLETKKQKLLAFNIIKKLFTELKFENQVDLLEEISEKNKRENYSKICLNADEVVSLNKNSLITLGSHSHTHLNMKVLDEKEIINEVLKSSKIFENLTNKKVKHFAYPFGMKEHASLREYNIIKNLEFNSAVTGQVLPIKSYNLFSLPRIYVGKNTCEKTLINHLSGFYNLINKFI